MLIQVSTQFRIPAQLRAARLLSAVLLSLLLVTPLAKGDTIRLRTPVSSAQRLNAAVRLLRQGKLKEADTFLQQIQEGDPAYLTAQLGRAQIAVTDRQLSAADHTVDGVLAKQPRLPEAHNMKGVLLLLHKNINGARQEFSQALTLQPLYVTPRVYLAVLDRANGDLAAAATEYRHLTEAAPRLPAGYLGEAEALTMLHREPEAIHVLERWKAADPHTALPYRVLANIYLADHQFQPALEQLKAALANAPRDAATLAELGDAYTVAANPIAAAAQYRAALAVDPRSTEAALGLGGLEASAGHWEAALAHYQLVLSLQPANAVAANDAAWVLATGNGNLDQALKLAQGAVVHDPRYADGYDTLGWILYLRGDYLRAITALTQAQSLQPASAEIAGHLGLAYARSGKSQIALTELKRALADGNVSNRPELERTAAALTKGKS